MKTCDACNIKLWRSRIIHGSKRVLVYHPVAKGYDVYVAIPYKVNYWDPQYPITFDKPKKRKRPPLWRKKSSKLLGHVDKMQEGCSCDS